MVVSQEKHNNVTRIIVKTHLMHASRGTECGCDKALLIWRNNLTLVYKGGYFQNAGIMRSQGRSDRETHSGVIHEI